MKKTLLLSIILITFSNFAQTTVSWATKKALGNDLSARENAGMASLNNKLYILAGNTTTGPKDFTEYNPTNGELKKLKEFPAGNYLNNRILFAVQGKIYTFSTLGSGVCVYDFITNSWTALGSLVAGLSPDSGFVINDIIYLMSASGNGFYAYNSATNTFTQKANYPGIANRNTAIAFEINAKGYFGSGIINNGCADAVCYTNNFYEYNPLTDTWTTKANLPYSPTYASGIGHNGKGYVGLGEVFGGFGKSPNKSSAWYEYDPITNTWTQKQNLMNLPSVTSEYGKASSSISKIGNEIYIFGGQTQNDGNFYADDVFKYDISTNNWQIVDADLGKNRINASGFYANGKIYVGNGEDSEGLNDFWEYTIATNQWSQKANLNSTHCQRASVEINGNGYFIGGYNAGIVNTTLNPTATYTDTLLEYNPITNIWTPKAAYPGGKRTGMVSFAYNGKLYAGLGRNTNGAATADFYEYNLLTNSWKTLTSAPVTGIHLSYFVLDNTAFIVGPSQVYKYNFSLNTWSSESHSFNNLGLPKYTNQAFTYQGKAYIVNGTQYDDQLSEYNPTTGTWKQTINLPFSSQGQSIIVSPNSVYFGFGFKPGKIRNTNDWQELRFDAGVSDNVGIYESISNNSCGTGILSETATNSIYDDNGDLFLTLKSGSYIPSLCVEINSIDLNQNFRTASANFGNGFLENGMFLNKSVLFKNGGINASDSLKLYYTTTELNKLVQDFNTLYNSNKTLQDIILVTYYSGNDRDPLNNVTTGVLYKPTLQSFGADKYFEISPKISSVIGGEIYAVILSGENLGTTNFTDEIASVYPNPTNSILNIKTKNNTVFDKVIITDLTGKILKEETENTLQINVQNLASGIYILEAISAGKKFTNKFIKL